MSTIPQLLDHVYIAKSNVSDAGVLGGKWLLHVMYTKSQFSSATRLLALLEIIAEVPHWQIAKQAKSSIFFLFFLSFFSQASTIANGGSDYNDSNTNRWIFSGESFPCVTG